MFNINIVADTKLAVSLLFPFSAKCHHVIGPMGIISWLRLAEKGRRQEASDSWHSKKLLFLMLLMNSDIFSTLQKSESYSVIINSQSSVELLFLLLEKQGLNAKYFHF